MRTRIEFRDFLANVIGIKDWLWDPFSFVNGVIRSGLYFQPPNKAQMHYPCVVYGLNNYQIEHSNNKPYIGHKNYLVTIIDKNPDSEYPEKMFQIPYCRFERHYTTDNLNHWVFSVYY